MVATVTLPYTHRYKGKYRWIPSLRLRRLGATAETLGRTLDAKAIARSGELTAFWVAAATEAHARKKGIPREKVDIWREEVPTELIQAANEGRVSTSVLTYPLTRPRYYQESLELDTEVARAKFRKVCALLETMTARCKEHGIDTRLMFAPAPCLYDPKAFESVHGRLYERLGRPWRREWLTETTPLQRELAVWASSHGVPFLDLTVVFRAAIRGAEGTLNYPVDGHWTARGHEIAADAVYRWLEDSP